MGLEWIWNGCGKVDWVGNGRELELEVILGGGLTDGRVGGGRKDRGRQYPTPTTYQKRKKWKDIWVDLTT